MKRLVKAEPMNCDEMDALWRSIHLRVAKKMERIFEQLKPGVRPAVAAATQSVRSTNASERHSHEVI